jgi:hypothetical protein
VAPEGFAHPVYQSGFAMAVPIALKPKSEPRAPASGLEAEGRLNA